MSTPDLNTVQFGSAAATDATEADKHNAAMIAKFDAATAPVVTPAVEPVVEPPKVAEAPKTPDPVVEPPKVEDKDVEAPKEAEKAVEAAGLNMESLIDKFVDKGDLEATDYEALAKVGISKELVTSYAEGQKALAAQVRAQTLGSIGLTEDSFNEVVQWAATNMSKEEIAVYNDSVSRKASLAQQKMAVEALAARYQRTVGTTPRLVTGQAAKSSGGEVYQSMAQWKADMADPLYAKDSAFRAKVMAKLSRSNI